MLGFEGYAEDANTINSEMNRFRADRDNIVGMNKQLKEQAEQTFQTKNIESIIENVGIVGATKGIHSFVKKGYDYKFKRFGDKGLKDLDERLGKKMGLSYKKKLKAKTKGGEAKEGEEEEAEAEAEPEFEAGGEVERGAGEEDSLSSFIQRTRNRLTQQARNKMSQLRNRISQQEEGKYDDVEEPEEGVEMQPMERAQAQEEGVADEEDVNKALDDNVSPEEFQEHLDSKYNFSEEAGAGEGAEAGELGGEAAEAAASAGADVASGAAEGVAAAAGDIASGAAGAATEAVAGGIEAVGSALDSTGVLAPFGFLLNIAGLFAAGVGAAEAGMTIAKELAGPDDKDIPKIPVPKQPKTMAQKGLLVTPHFNSLDTYGSINTAW